jgi:hypothetical protein
MAKWIGVLAIFALAAPATGWCGNAGVRYYYELAKDLEYLEGSGFTDDQALDFATDALANMQKLGVPQSLQDQMIEYVAVLERPPAVRSRHLRGVLNFRMSWIDFSAKQPYVAVGEVTADAVLLAGEIAQPKQSGGDHSRKKTDSVVSRLDRAIEFCDRDYNCDKMTIKYLKDLRSQVKKSDCSHDKVMGIVNQLNANIRERFR